MAYGKSPFKLGSKKHKGSYGAMQAKGLISPMENKTERDKDYDRKKKAAELTFITRMKESGLSFILVIKESGLSLEEYKKTKEGAQLAKDVQTVESQRQGYGG